MSTPFGRDQKRDVPQMPGSVKAALAKDKLTDAYRARPEYQRHEYLNAIHRAKGPEAKQARLTQMIDELKKGDVFMGAEWHPPAPVK